MHQALYDALQRVARRHTLTSYGEVATVVGIRINPATIGSLGRLLDEIGRHEHQHGRPLLPVLVVRKAEGTPGAGFYALARELGLLSGEDASAEQGFFARERQRVYATWSRSGSNPSPSR